MRYCPRDIVSHHCHSHCMYAQYFHDAHTHLIITDPSIDHNDLAACNKQTRPGRPKQQVPVVE